MTNAQFATLHGLLVVPVPLSTALVPLRKPSEQLDPRARWIALLIASAVRSFDRRYGFRRLERYESKFRPSSWEPRYLAFLPALPRPVVVRAALRML